MGQVRYSSTIPNWLLPASHQCQCSLPCWWWTRSRCSSHPPSFSSSSCVCSPAPPPLPPSHRNVWLLAGNSCLVAMVSPFHRWLSWPLLTDRCWIRVTDGHMDRAHSAAVVASFQLLLPSWPDHLCVFRIPWKLEVKREAAVLRDRLEDPRFYTTIGLSEYLFSLLCKVSGSRLLWSAY